MKKRNPAADYAMIVAGTFLIALPSRIFTTCEHGYGRCVGRGHYCQGTVVCSSVADQYSVKHPVICSRILFCGWRFIKRTLFATVMLSVSLYVLPRASYLGMTCFCQHYLGES